MNIVPRNCDIPYVCIKPANLNSKFERIGAGSEGIVYKYDDSTAIKMFNPKRFPNKIDKIKKLYHLSDDNFCFPTGLVFTRRDDLIGFKMDFINVSSEFNSFLELVLDHIPNGNIDLNKLYDILFKIDYALKRAHSYEYRIGDFRPKNILLNQFNEPIFIDTDGGSYKNYGCDITPPRSTWANRVYNRSFSKEDSDKYVWAIMFLESILIYNNFNKKYIPFIAIELYQNKELLRDLVSDLSITKEMKEGLNIIFSDADNKPYIGDIFKNFDCNKPIISDFKERLFALKVYMK